MWWIRFLMEQWQTGSSMEVLHEQIKSFLESGKVGSNPDFQAVKELTLKYPYFQGLLFYYLKALYVGNGPGFHPELHRLAPLVADRTAWFYAIFSEEYAIFFKKTGKTELPGDRTGVLLGAFFNQLADSSDKGDGLDENLLNAGIVSVDYFSYLEKSDQSGPVFSMPESSPKQEVSLRHQHIIDDFIEKSDNGEDFKIRIRLDDNAAEPSSAEPQAGDDSLEDSMFFTETLARIYIKQKKYEKAYQIIKQLSLNYPEKNIYFADQIRFLEKLMMNTSNNK